MASSILKEIEDLHAFLEQKEYHPGQQFDFTSPPKQVIPAPAPAGATYSNNNINHAEVKSSRFSQMLAQKQF
jgi:hypothetical protein